MIKRHVAAGQYLRTQVESATPLELVVLLYDGALSAMVAARDAMARRDIAARRDAINKAMRIVAHLQSTLDMDGGGQIAKDLDRLYTWVMSRLVKATSEQRTQPLEEARQVLNTLATGWRGIANRSTAGAQP